MLRIVPPAFVCHVSVLGRENNLKEDRKCMGSLVILYDNEKEKSGTFRNARGLGLWLCLAS